MLGFSIGFSLFYAGINVGAFIGGYVCIAIGKGHLFSDLIDVAHRWNVAFGLAAFVMVISLINFFFTKRSLGPIGLQPKDVDKQGNEVSKPLWKELTVYGCTILAIPLIMAMVKNTDYTDYFMFTIGPLTLIYLFYEMTKVTVEERKKLYAALVFNFFSLGVF